MDRTDFLQKDPFPFTKEMNKIKFPPKFHDAGCLCEVGTSIKRGDICWFNGPFPCGLIPDIKKIRLNIKKALMPGEMVVCDKGYKGNP